LLVAGRTRDRHEVDGERDEPALVDGGEDPLVAHAPASSSKATSTAAETPAVPGRSSGSTARLGPKLAGPRTSTARSLAPTSTARTTAARLSPSASAKTVARRFASAAASRHASSRAGSSART